MSDEDLEAFKRIFIMFDKVGLLSDWLVHSIDRKDGDGTVSTKELGAVLRSLGGYNIKYIKKY